MSSSTSSSRSEFKVVAAVVLVLLAVEMVMRAAEGRLSIDLAHIRSGPEVAERLKASSQESVLLLGNSLTREGVDSELLASAGSKGSLVEGYYPDGSSVNEWVYAYRRFFAETGKIPDYLIIGAGRSHLFDAHLPPDRFGAYFCSNRDIPRYFSRHVDSPDDAAGFLLARASVAYANRHRVQPRIFSVLVPHYQEVLPRLTAKPRGSGVGVEHRNLAELLEVARSAGTRVAVVAIPMPEAYPVPETTREIIARGGAHFIDARDLPGISPGRFPDNYHLDHAGAELVTNHIVEALQPLWWPDSRD